MLPWSRKLSTQIKIYIFTYRNVVNMFISADELVILKWESMGIRLVHLEQLEVDIQGIMTFDVSMLASFFSPRGEVLLQTQRSFWRQVMVTWMWLRQLWVASGGQWAVEWHVPFQADRKSDVLLHSGPSVRGSLCIKGDPLEGHCSIFESLCSERPINTRGCAVHIKSDSYNGALFLLLLFFFSNFLIFFHWK